MFLTPFSLQREMNPPMGEAGGPRQVRVCDPCFRSGQTFDFRSTPQVNHTKSFASLGNNLRRQHSQDGLSKLADSPSKHSQSARSIRPVASAPCLQSLNVGSPLAPVNHRGTLGLGLPGPFNKDPNFAGSGTAQRRDSDDEHSSTDTMLSSSNPSTEHDSAGAGAGAGAGVVGDGGMRAPKPYELVTLPQEIKTGKGTGERRSSRTIDQLANGDKELSEQFKRLEANYAHSSYYRGLLEYEPNALKALLLSEVRAQKRAVNAT
jgi:hypothetical protein